MLTAVPAHAFLGIILGYFMGKAKFCPNPWKHLTLGLVTVIIFHGTYDSVAMSDISWSIYPILGIAVFVFYLGLKAKKDLEKTSKRIEFSSSKFFLLEDTRKKEPLVLKEIRDRLSKGSLKLDDILVSGKSDKKTSIRTLLSAQIGLEAKVRAKTPPRVWPAKRVVVFYGLTFGLYLYFWFHKNYRNFKNYKNLRLDPELRTLGLFVFTTIPFFTYGTLLEKWKAHPFGPSIEISFNVMIAGIEAAFLYFLFRMISEFLKWRTKNIFPHIIHCPDVFCLEWNEKTPAFGVPLLLVA